MDPTKVPTIPSLRVLRERPRPALVIFWRVIDGQLAQDWDGDAKPDAEGSGSPSRGR